MTLFNNNNGKRVQMSAEEEAQTRAEWAAEPPVVEVWRGRVTLSRTDFCIALKRAGILTGAQAIQAAKGDWPVPFAAALANFPDADEAEIAWAGASQVDRNSPLLEPLRVAAGLTAEQLDTMFGYTGV